MATKWKSFTRSCRVRAAAIVLLLAMAALVALQTALLWEYAAQENRSLDGRALFESNLPPAVLSEKLISRAEQLLMSASCGDEESIRSGAFINTKTKASWVYARFLESFYNKYGDDKELLEHLPALYPAAGTDQAAVPGENEIESMVAAAQQEDVGNEADSECWNLFRLWLKKNPGAFAACTQDLVSEQLEAYRRSAQEIQEQTDCDYFILVGSSSKPLSDTDSEDLAAAENVEDLWDAIELSNIDSEDLAAARQKMRTNDYYLLLEMKNSRTPALSSRYLSGADVRDLQEQHASELEELSQMKDIGGAQIHGTALVGLRESSVRAMQTEWTAGSRRLRQYAALVGAAMLLSLLCLIVLLCGAGHRTAADGVNLIWFDRIWTEVQLIVFFSALGLWLALMEVLAASELTHYVQTPAINTAAVTATVALTALTLGVLLSQVRRIKLRRWLDGFPLVRLFKKYVVPACCWLMSQLRKTPLRRRVIVLSVVLPLVCALRLPIPFVIAGLLYFGMRTVDRFEAVTDGAEAIRTGKSDTHIALTGAGPELTHLAENLNGISDGLHDAVDTAVKSERLKAELISNVSHDIKTPLTGIITYIDLLKQCGIADPTARDYIEVLDQKAQRLRILTGDLFDASKASSGAMKVELQQTDFDALLRQALGERSGELEQAQLDVRVQSEPRVYVRADGRLLWRILDNLLSNCARYALPGSRVYIDLQSDAETASLTMKNISAASLNISADELMERFTRGDRSRHTEGSGLGLSIAKSLAELMEGSCHVEIDGDLFKAVVTIPIWA